VENTSGPPTPAARAAHGFAGQAPVLYVVATPIGNLEDLSFRALRILREVDLVAAEDTRRTLKLLTHYEIRKPLISVREHNEARESARLCTRMLNGERVALVSDAGTPGIADPGARLVRAARDAGIRVVPVPGPSAVTTALSISGFPTELFVLLGCPPRGGQARQNWLNDLSHESRVCVFFEAPHFIERTAREARSACTDRPIIIVSELTKIHENLAVIPINEAPADLKDRGEFVVVIGPRSVKMRSGDQVDASRDAELLYDSLTSRAQTDEEAIQLTSRALGIADQAVRKIVKKHKISVKRHTESVP